MFMSNQKTSEKTKKKKNEDANIQIWNLKTKTFEIWCWLWNAWNLPPAWSPHPASFRAAALAAK